MRDPLSLSLHLSLSGFRFLSFCIVSCCRVCTLSCAGHTTLPHLRSSLWEAYWPLQNRKYKGHTLPRASYTRLTPAHSGFFALKPCTEPVFVSDFMLRFYSLGIFHVYGSVVGVWCCGNTEMIHGLLFSKSSSVRADMIGAQITRNCGKT